MTVDTCTETCWNLDTQNYGQYALSMKFGTGANAGHCYCYQTACTDSTGESGIEYDVYDIRCPCYWTEPLLVHANSNCGNEDALMGAGVTNDIAGSNLYNCNYWCNEQAACESFSLNSGNVCSLFNSGVCTEFTEAGTNHYVKTWFKELAFLTTATCTHLSVYEEEGKNVAACKSHNTLANCKAAVSTRDNVGEAECYYLQHALSACEGTHSGTSSALTGATLAECKTACTNNFYCNAFLHDASSGNVCT
jgi:hypothetical protein